MMAVFAGEKAPTKTSEPVLVNDYDMRSDYEALLARGCIGKCPSTIRTFSNPSRSWTTSTFVHFIVEH